VWRRAGRGMGGWDGAARRGWWGRCCESARARCIGGQVREAPALPGNEHCFRSPVVYVFQGGRRFRAECEACPRPIANTARPLR
jgi:hypothetical protein